MYNVLHLHSTHITDNALNSTNWIFGMLKKYKVKDAYKLDIDPFSDKG